VRASAADFKVVFTPNVQRHVLCPEAEAPGYGYVLDDQSGLWRHMAELALSPCARMKLRAEMPEDLGKFRGLLAGYDDGPA
jgi:hypothetical protein